MSDKKPIVIGVGGFARSGKDTFVKIARKILKEHGYSSIKLAFADALKEEIDPFLVQNYGISAWTDDTEQKKIIRPFLVAHGCGKRQQTNGRYWVEKIDKEIEGIFCEDVVFISDCRFPNEVDWVHEKWGGWFVHLSKYNMVNDIDYKFDYESHPELDGTEHPEQYYPDDFIETPVIRKVYDKAPNAEEAENDPICARKADARLEMENAIDREFRLTGNKITVDSLIDNTYLNEEIKLCLLKCPLLTLQ
jgi:hypothetical protein